ncbi:short-chain dehydrogenase/reductase SDR [Ancylobacter novellus DSM 506]|uniref:Short-chain dehydrogenase/reductase SDR n=1 Tax=Ancylobacter novellus (strain ATCC 8093 / DSM 506 / JCM 20403 / CCM 1077 / IAM 12100 / NBRC 12443 / NCIMB 10456) TaxID=639283 RepID=D7A8D9_ANCN5|nr:SDR family NAD(P)-dependent oxidoreductase [Ancylobacter novellus]ADH88612.1 short-chain dehydrogenase/reductase SDR [Ancylobacter novellus DSM 506]
MSRQTWFITGASSGLGAAIAKAALRAGHRVAATARDSARLSRLAEAGGERVLALSMDLTVPDQIEAAVAAAESWNGIDVLVNNAALGYLAAVEEGEDTKIRTLFETNVFGLAHTIRAALPGMRRRGAGTIINVSSFNGVVAMPSLGYYSATKFAVEGLTEALAQEVAPLGIKVLAVEPGGIRTGIVERNLRSPPIDAYRETAHAIIDLLENDRDGTLAPSDPDRIADILVRLAETGEMPRRLIVGADAWAGITSALDARRAEYEAWKDLAHATSFA